jgi:hypothetical protein
MKEELKTGYSERLKTAAAAKTALLAKMRPKPTQVDPELQDRRAVREAELVAVRQQRDEAKAARRQAAAEAVLAAEQARLALEAAALDAKRGERKQRKALSNAEAKTKKDAKFAAYRTRS